jgi:hypothetical protein
VLKLNEHALTLELLPGTFGVAQLESETAVPAWAESGAFHSVTRTQAELSIVCMEAAIPITVKAQRGFRCLRVRGPLDFGLTGILASLAVPLAQAGISIFALSTYDTDYLLLLGHALEAAIAALTQAGHVVVGQYPPNSP